MQEGNLPPLAFVNKSKERASSDNKNENEKDDEDSDNEKKAGDKRRLESDDSPQGRPNPQPREGLSPESQKTTPASVPALPDAVSVASS